MYNVASSVTLLFSLIDKLYKFLNLKPCGVCVKKELLRFKLKSSFLTLYLIESFDFITGTTALFFLSVTINFFKSSKLKFGLAAS